ncbi:MAG: nucleotide pyrophosphohydrolase [Bacteroidetes bacterium 41-46]|nr:MAG: nucleotide pyrophosphohydrolase [Bacteroidetes bacterium 41-46]
MSELNELISKIVKFRDDRDWAQFHNPKDLAIALNIEASELLELFLWKKENDANRERLKEELADVMIYALLLADKFDFDVHNIIEEKLVHNSKKYPVDKAKGNAKKYNEL